MIRIAHISDLHFGDAAPDKLAAAATALAAIKPDCIVATGDITQAGRAEEFAAARAWFAALGAPVVGCPGNHDAPVYALHRRFTTPFSRFRTLGLAAAWRDAAGAAAVEAFNSARAAQWRLDWSQGAYRPSAVSDAAARLTAATPNGWRLLACHHPPVTPEGAAVPARTRRGGETLARLSGVDRLVLLSGHVHRFTLAQRRGVTVVTAPSLASSRERGDGAGFVVLTLGPAPEATRWRFSGAWFEPAETRPLN